MFSAKVMVSGEKFVLYIWNKNVSFMESKSTLLNKLCHPKAYTPEPCVMF